MRLFPLLVLSLPAVAQDLTNDAGLPDEEFGASVAVDGDWAVVGAPGDSDLGPDAGAAYVFHRVNDQWQEVTKLLPQTGPQDIVVQPLRFGTSVTLREGHWIVVGAPAHDTGLSGSAWVFWDSGDGWVFDHVLEAAIPQSNDHFGQSVALDGEYLVVGAPRTDEAQVDQGSAELFQFQVDRFEHRETFYGAPHQSPSDYFGFAVDIDMPRVVVGSYAEDTAGVNAGCAWLFEQQGGVWSDPPQILLPSVYEENSLFGRSVSVRDERVLVGQPGAGEGGLATLFERDLNGEWQGALFTPSAVGSDAAFGYAVEVAPEGVIMTAPSAHIPSFFSGALVVWTGQEWEDERTQYGPLNKSFFGRSLASSEDTVFLGAPAHNLSRGAVYIYDMADLFRPMAEEFCRCDTGPCTDDPDAGCPNSSGTGGHLTASGSGSLTRDNLRLHAAGLPTGLMAMPLLGREGTGVNVGDGQLCLTGKIYRYPLVGSGFGAFAFGPGLLGYAEAGFTVPPAITPGETWAFQVWFRDPQGSCGGGSNLTNAVSVTFWP